MALTQCPVTEVALAQGLHTDAPAWKQLPSWFVFGDQDRNIPLELLRFRVPAHPASIRVGQGA